MGLLDDSAVPYSIVLTKADKPKKAELETLVAEIEKALVKHPAAMPGVLPTSSRTGLGIAELRASLAQLAGGAP